MTLYMAVTPDKYELPIAIESTLEDIAEVFNINVHTVACAISRNRSGKRNGVKFLKVEVDG